MSHWYDYEQFPCPIFFYPKPTRIIRQDRATIVMFDDGTKRVVRLQDGEEDDIYDAICIAIAKRFLGSGAAIKNLVKQVEYLPGKSKAATPENPKPMPKRQKHHQYGLSAEAAARLEELFYDLFDEMQERSQ